MIMLSALKSDKVEGTAWLQPFQQDFRTRFLTLLAGAYKVMKLLFTSIPVFCPFSGCIFQPSPQLAMAY